MALPEINTRSPTNSQFNSPPRDDSCLTLNRLGPILEAQYGASCVYAEPVTGSSRIPYLGAKKRVLSRQRKQVTFWPEIINRDL